jgi:hypothetical protein
MSEPYRLVRPVAFGGLAFEAVNTQTGRRVFVRLCPEVRRVEELVALFSAASCLTCPHTVRILDIGMADLPVPIGYVVTEFVDGPSLDVVIEERQILAQNIAVKLAIQVLAALEEAHASGLTHGNIRASQVLLARGTLGEPIAKLAGFETKQEARGNTDSLQDVFSDLRAAASLLFRLVFGRELGEDRASLEAVAQTAPQLTAVLANALGWGACQYRTPTQFGAALTQVLSQPLRQARQGQVSMLDAVSLGAVYSSRELFPERFRDAAARALVVWVLSDDSALRCEPLSRALDELSSDCEIVRLGPVEQARCFTQLETGECQPPWLILFGAMHVRRAEPLLGYLASCRELCRLLVCERLDADALRVAARNFGVDGCITASGDEASVLGQLSQLLERARSKSHHYDQIRRELRGTLDEVGELSRTASAEDVAEVPSSRSWSMRVMSALDPESRRIQGEVRL